MYQLHAIKYAELNGRKRTDLFVAGDPHDGRIDMDYFIWVAIHVDRRTAVVVDTGFGPEVAAKRGRSVLRSPVEPLATLEVEAGAVRDVIVTHLHYDHAGNFALFPNARFHLQDRELAFATGRAMTHPFLRQVYEVEDVVTMIRLVYRDRVVFHDGDEEIVPGTGGPRIGGPPRGLQVVTVAPERGTVVLASDASHYYENFEQGRVFAIVDSAYEMLEGFRRVQVLAARPDLIVPGHDPEVLRRYPPSMPSLAGVAVTLDQEPRTRPS